MFGEELVITWMWQHGKFDCEKAGFVAINAIVVAQKGVSN